MRSVRSAARLPQGSPVISATNGKTTTAAIAAGIFKQQGLRLVHNRAGANMAGGIATTLLDASTRARRHRWRLWACSRSTSSGWASSSRSCARARSCSATCSATSSTVTGSWRASPSAGRRRSLRPRGAPPRSCSTLTTRSSPTSAASATRTPALYFGVEDDSLALPGMSHAADAKHCRRCGAPYVFDAVYLGHLGHYHCPILRPAPRPRPPVIATDVVLKACVRARFTLSTPAGSAQVQLALPGLYNVYNALAAAALATALEFPSRRSSPACRPRRPPSAAPRRGGSRAAAPTGARAAHPARQEPGGRQRGAAHARARARTSTTCSACSTTTSPTGATSPGSGTPTSSCLPGACAASPAAGSRARRPGRAAEVRRHRAGPHPRARGPCGRAGSSRVRSPHRSARRRCTRCPPTPRCSRCASCWCARGGAQRMGLADAEGAQHLAARDPSRAAPPTRPARCLARPGVRRLPRRPAAVARACRRRTRDGSDPRRRRRQRARGARPRPRGAPRDRAGPRPCAAGRAARARRQLPMSRRCAPTRATSRCPAASRPRLCLVPMQTLQLLGGETGRAALPALRPRRTCAPAACSPARSSSSWSRSTAPTAASAPPRAARTRRRLYTSRATRVRSNRARSSASESPPARRRIAQATRRARS